MPYKTPITLPVFALMGLSLSLLCLSACAHKGPHTDSEVNYEGGADRKGNDYFAFPTTFGPEACAAACESDTRCRAFTWVKPGFKKRDDPAQCFLKAPSPSPSQSSCCVSGVIRP